MVSMNENQLVHAIQFKHALHEQLVNFAFGADFVNLSSLFHPSVLIVMLDASLLSLIIKQIL